MNCPKCGNPKIRYNDKKKKQEVRKKDKSGNEYLEKIYMRDSNKAKCKKCKWEGTI